MRKSNKFSPEVRERAVRMVQEHRGEYPSLWSAIESIAPKIGCVPQTLLDWVKQSEVDTGDRSGVTTAEQDRIKDLERIYRRLGLPATQIHALEEPVQGRLPHGEGIHNTAYRSIWQQMLRVQP